MKHPDLVLLPLFLVTLGCIIFLPMGWIMAWMCVATILFAYFGILLANQNKDNHE